MHCVEGLGFLQTVTVMVNVGAWSNIEGSLVVCFNNYLIVKYPLYRPFGPS